MFRPKDAKKLSLTFSFCHFILGPPTFTLSLYFSPSVILSLNLSLYPSASVFYLLVLFYLFTFFSLSFFLPLSFRSHLKSFALSLPFYMCECNLCYLGSLTSCVHINRCYSLRQHSHSLCSSQISHISFCILRDFSNMFSFAWCWKKIAVANLFNFQKIWI